MPKDTFNTELVIGGHSLVMTMVIEDTDYGRERQVHCKIQDILTRREIINSIRLSHSMLEAGRAGLLEETCKKIILETVMAYTGDRLKYVMRNLVEDMDRGKDNREVLGVFLHEVGRVCNLKEEDTSLFFTKLTGMRVGSASTVGYPPPDYCEGVDVSKLKISDVEEKRLTELYGMKLPAPDWADGYRFGTALGEYIRKDVDSTVKVSTAIKEDKLIKMQRYSEPLTKEKILEEMRKEVKHEVIVTDKEVIVK